ncbi:MAG TPA: aspartate kinase [Pseudobdellovibrionaceae bacterium]|nr:aspartate kinase [Pseudobdellovibrionaceae bacterium]
MPKSTNPTTETLVLKFGGMSLATPEHLRQAAQVVADAHRRGHAVVVVVSAMGKTTDQLQDLAYSVSPAPNRRELDMLLSTGERVSMALFSMALNDHLGARGTSEAISFTGSQAGVMTDATHSSARITDVRATRVRDELAAGHVVVIAGFQGVNPLTKEITTLGRGGSDVTAVAMAAHLSDIDQRAVACEIRKEVPGVMTADPKLVPEARLLQKLTHAQLLEMCFWGAKVLHYRSVELATLARVTLKVNLATSAAPSQHGTRIHTGDNMIQFESDRLLALNSIRDVVRVQAPQAEATAALISLRQSLDAERLPRPQILETQTRGAHTEFLLTAPSEALEAQIKALTASGFRVDADRLAVLTATCVGSYSSDLMCDLAEELKKSGIAIRGVLTSPMSLSFLVAPQDLDRGLKALHARLPTN